MIRVNYHYSWDTKNICWKENLTDPTITFNLSISDVSMKLRILNFGSYDLESIKNFRDCLKNGEICDNPIEIDGGANNHWCMSCKNFKLILLLAIENQCPMEQGGLFTGKWPCELVLNQFNQLIDLKEHILRNEKYCG